MNREVIRLLLVEDNPADVQLLQELMVEADPARFALTVVDRLTTSLEQLSRSSFDVTLLDLSLPDSQGVGTLLRLRAVAPEMPVVVLTGLNDEDLGVQLIQAGAQDYLVKGQVSSPLLLRSVLYAIERKRGRAGLKTRARQQAAVAELGQRALVSDKQASLLDEAATLVAQALRVEYSQVLERLPDRNTLCLRAGVGWPAGLAGQATLEVQKDSHTDYTLLSREPVIVEDFRTETRFKKVAWPLDYGVVSGMSVVIEGQAGPFGILGVYTGQQRRFTEDDIHFLQAMAHVLAVAIERQRTEKALQYSIQELEIAYQQAIIYAQELNAEGLERKQAEKKVLRLNAELEQRVAKRTAQLSAANAELARAARLKDEFLANMSHELRTPLNAILGLAEALQEQTRGPLNEHQLKSMRIIEESGRHLLALINDILDVSKIEAGKLELQPEFIAVEVVCQASFQFIKEAAVKKKIGVSLSLDPTVTTIRADSRRLKQILVNLLSNAVKFTPIGGQVGLEIKAEPEQEIIYCTVWDTGIGIAPEHLPELFQPFMQIDSSLSRQYEGTGLGLTLVYRLTELHGGSVTVESEPGRGSRFTVALPWTEKVETVAPVEPGEAAPAPATLHRVWDGEAPQKTQVNFEPGIPPELAVKSEPPPILLAEDNEANIQLMTNFLAGEGYRIVVARTGLEAVDQAKEVRPALILMDIQMPGMDGLEATRRIRAEADLAHIPIISLTALAMPDDRERCLAAGANDYLSKPVSLKKLVATIAAYLEPAKV